MSKNPVETLVLRIFHHHPEQQQRQQGPPPLLNKKAVFDLIRQGILAAGNVIAFDPPLVADDFGAPTTYYWCSC
jgi:hypothetical protein